MDKSAARYSGDGGVIVCLSPCVCLTPAGGRDVKVPYMIASKLAWSERTLAKVTFAGDEAFTMNSRTQRVVGNEAGKSGGVASGVSEGWCRPQSNKTNFFIKSHEVIRHDSVFEMNCDGPDGRGNTVGKLNYDDRR